MPEITIITLLEQYTNLALVNNNLEAAIKLNWYSNALKTHQADLDDVFEGVLSYLIHGNRRHHDCTK